MNKIIPIVNLVVSITGLIVTIIGVIFAGLVKLFALFAAFAIVFIMIGFTLSVLSCAFGFAFSKSKLCITAGIIATISVFIGIIGFVILL